ncbi:MAG: serine/threonine protein kinase, partial [Deltaproteobacteria bacterium]|nr:serine/threonine protein kinase [Deltaproteobacteria bacterium]
MAATPTSDAGGVLKPSSKKRDEMDDTVPARGEIDGDPPIRPTIPLDRYRIGKELGRGGMGRVVEAFDVQLGRTVALKEVLTKGTHRRFAREIHITARLEHASIVPLYDSGITMEGKPFYVMRKVSGKPLDEMVARCIDLDERLTLLPRLLSAIDAVAHAHSRGVIHRDIKPQNILLAELGETVVIDWGLAKVVGEEEDEPQLSAADTHDADAGDSLRTQVGSVFGTPGFMAPEQARGEALDTQGDVYALGATLYQLLSGEPPVRGVSATEVMDKTRTHDIRPLTETASGAPPDLVAIATKALAFDPNNRYRDAGELAADVRRFLEGQLVAAHDYTTRQRLARFARRYRGVLSVTALAAVAVAVMSWIGVHRILSERDAATQARLEADEDRRLAVEARDRLAERHDALVVMQARAQLDANPTESVAILKQLPATSPRIDEARGIASAAALRGATFAIQTTTEAALQAEIAPDGRHLLQVTHDGMVRVFDLDLRRMIVSRTFGVATRAEWIADGKLLVYNRKTAAVVFDPKTSVVEQLAFTAIETAWPTASGDRAIVRMSDYSAALFDAATKTLTPIPFDGKVTDVAIAKDGSWYAVSSRKLLVVFDRAGQELSRRTDKLGIMMASRARTLAVLYDSKIAELTLDPTPVWTEIPLTAAATWMSYRGRELVIFQTTGDVQGWKGTKVYRRGTFDRLSPMMREGGDDVLVWLRDDGKLNWIGDLGRGAVAIPTVAHRARLAVRPGAQRMAVVGDGAVVVFDLAMILPQRIAGQSYMKALFVDDQTLLVMRDMQAKFEWHDLATGKVSTVDYNEMHLPIISDVDPIDGRVLMREEHARNGPRFVLLRKGRDRAETVVEGDKPWARLVAGNAIVYGLGDSQVFARIGDEPARMVAKLDGVSTHGVGIGLLQFAAHSSTGEVVKGDLRTGAIERVRVPTGTDGFLASDGKGRVFIVEDNRLLIWDGQVSEIAKFDKPIDRVFGVEGGVAIQTGRERAIYVLELRAGAAPHRVVAASTNHPAFATNGKLLAAAGNGREIQMIELPSRARWTLPTLSTARDGIGMSPSGTALFQQTDTGIVIWRIPRIGRDFAAWLDDRSNGVVDKDGVLGWSWQSP